MNPPDYKRLGEIGAQAAFADRSFPSSYLCVDRGNAQWSKEENGRTAFARAVIEEHQRITRDQAGEGMPTIEEFSIAWHAGPIDSRNLMLSAFARKMEAVAKLPEKWRKEEDWMSNDAGFQSGRKEQLKLCVEEFEAALGSPADAPAKPDLSAECKMSLRLMADKLRKCCETHGLGQCGESAENVVIAAVEELTGKLAAAEEKAKLWETRYTDERNRFHALNGSLMIERQQLAAAEARLALLEWRPVSVKPTEKDADADGNVILMTNYGITVRCRYDNLAGIHPDWKWWHPFCPPPAPTAEDVSRQEFEREIQTVFDGGWPHGLEKSPTGEYYVHESQVAFRIWQAARASKEAK